jgi:hypothetical protein
MACVAETLRSLVGFTRMSRGGPVSKSAQRQAMSAMLFPHMAPLMTSLPRLSHFGLRLYGQPRTTMGQSRYNRTASYETRWTSMLGVFAYPSNYAMHHTAQGKGEANG